MTIGFGLIGTGFMGKTHALAMRQVRAVLGGVPEVRLELLCDTPAEQAADRAGRFGFARSTGDWRDVVSDPSVDVVSITTPNGLHREIALAALAAGKHVWCEKPMALTLAEAREMTEAARAAGTVTLVGYNYIRNPAFTHAQRLIAEGRIGRVVHFRGYFDEDYQADPDLPWSWRAQLSEAGLGAFGDMGSHVVSLAAGLVGPVRRLVADVQIVHETRRLPDGSGRAAVENDDVATALLQFEGGAHGMITTSRAAWGRKNRIDWEVHGTRGQIAFDGERMNELRLYVNEGPKAEQGFRTILTAAEHPPYAEFCPAPGHQIGVLDLKAIEARDLLTAIAEERPAYPSFEDALVFERTFHAMAESARSGSWVDLAE